MEGKKLTENNTNDTKSMKDKVVGKRVRKMRDTLGFSQEEFGLRIGMTRSAISKIEKGWSVVTDKNKLLICQRFGINRDWLETGEGDMLQPELEPETIISMLDIADPLDVEIVLAYLRLDEKYRAAFRELLKGVVEQ